MDDKKYQVFVSSTYEDLIEARKKIIETVLSLYHLPVGMEMFSADDSEQWEIIKETIDASDYYVIIIGHRYGSISPSSGVSYTEMEYDYAKSTGVPVLAFIRERDVYTSPKERESDNSKSELLDRFIDKAKSNKLCNFWNSMDDLATKVAVALPKIMMRNPRIGWVRGNKIASTEISKEIAELSTENRRLREKLRDYESQLNSDAPELIIKNINSDLSFFLETNFERLSYFKPMDMNDIPEDLREELSVKELNEYNQRIPDDEAVNRYNRQMFLYENYQKCSITLSPVIENIGKKVATDIYVEVEYPDFIMVHSNSNKSLFKRAPKITTPVNLIVLAERKKRARESLRKMGLGMLDSNLPANSFFDGNDMTMPPRLLPDVPVVNQSKWIKYEKNRITLRAKKVLQSLSIEFDDVTFIPVAEGKGVTRFKIICEELKEPVIFTRQVTVIKK